MGGPALLEIGHVAKAHGLRGEVVVVMVSDRPERLRVGSRFHTDRGTLTVAAARPHQQRFIVAFEEVHDRAGADALRGQVLRAAPLGDPDALWVHEVVGREVVVADGSPCGRVDAVEANPADDLLVLDSGALVPARFVVGWDEVRRLVIDPPEGLLDL